MFFVLVESFIGGFDFCEVLDGVCIDVSCVYFWDFIVVNVLDKVVLKFCCEGIEVVIYGFNEVSVILVDCFGVYDKFDVVE